MHKPVVTITFKNMQSSPALERWIQKKARKLTRFADQITHIDVAVEAPHRQTTGERFHVRVEVRVPGTEILASQTTGRTDAHANAYVAVRDAFAAAQRQLQEYTRMRRARRAVA